LGLLDNVSTDLHSRGRFTSVQVGVERAHSPSLLGTVGHVVRRLRELYPVLYDPASCNGMDPKLPVYEIHRDMCSDAERDVLLRHDLRYDVTVMPPLMLGEECVKTIGHEHLPCGGGWSHPEVFEVIEGEALFLLQKHQGEELVDVSLVSTQKGDRVLIPPDCCHIMINASSSRLVVGNLVSRSCLQTYKRFIERRGGAYYLLRGDKLVRNENYRSPPDARMVKGGTFASAEDESYLLASFLRSPEQFKFLNYPWDLFFRRELQKKEQDDTLGVVKPKVAVVIPTMNEARCVEKVLREAGKHLGDAQILVVDASVDGTASIAARLGVKVLKQEGNGKGSALREAFDATTSDIVVVMDGDGSMRAEEIPQFIEVASSGADIVKGSRFLPSGGSQDLSLVRRVGNSLFLLLVNSVWSTRYTDLCYGYLAFRRNSLKKLKPHLTSTGFQIETEICIKAKKLGLRVLEVPSFELRRSHGKSKIHAIRDSLRILGTIFAEWISDFSHARGV